MGTFLPTPTLQVGRRLAGALAPGGVLVVGARGGARGLDELEAWLPAAYRRAP